MSELVAWHFFSPHLYHYIRPSLTDPHIMFLSLHLTYSIHIKHFIFHIDDASESMIGAGADVSHFGSWKRGNVN